MRLMNCLLPVALTVVLGHGPAQAGDKKVLVPGDPPLTQDMVDDYGKLAEWRLGPALAQIGGTERLAQLIVNDWKNKNKPRQKEILADLRWWREDFPKLSKSERKRLAARAPTTPSDVERKQQAAQIADAIHRLQLQQWNDARQAQIRALSNLQARHHELMMIIIGNMRPSGRYVYNPSSGRYDRWVGD